VRREANCQQDISQAVYARTADDTAKDYERALPPMKFPAQWQKPRMSTLTSKSERLLVHGSRQRVLSAQPRLLKLPDTLAQGQKCYTHKMMVLIRI